jgi:hypothetical protein
MAIGDDADIRKRLSHVVRILQPLADSKGPLEHTKRIWISVWRVSSCKAR